MTVLLPIYLVAFRLMPIFLVAPVGAFRRVPVMVRVVLVVALAIIFQTETSIANESVIANTTVWALFASEFLIGMSLAFSFHAANAAMQTMGQLIDLQVGFAAGAVFDPSTEQMVSPTGELFGLLMMVSLVLLNVHHDLLRGFSALLSVLPPGQPVQWSAQWLSILGVHFSLGLIVASPVILTLWFVDAALAFISRSLPQAPIYFVGLPVKVGIGILTLAWFCSHAMQPLLRVLTEALVSWNLMFDV